MSTTAGPLTEDVLRQLMLQVGLDADPTDDSARQMLRRINQLGDDQVDNRDSDTDEDNCGGSSTDGYDTVCDEGDVSSNTDSDFNEEAGDRNNNGTNRHHRPRQQQEQQSHTDAADQVTDNLGNVNDQEGEAVASLEARMNGVILSAIEGLKGAFGSLLQMQEKKPPSGAASLVSSSATSIVSSSSSALSASSTSTSSHSSTPQPSLNESTNCRRRSGAGCSSPSSDSSSSRVQHKTVTTGASTVDWVPGVEASEAGYRTDTEATTDVQLGLVSCSSVGESADKLLKAAAGGISGGSGVNGGRRGRDTRRLQSASGLAQRLDNLEVLLLTMEQQRQLSGLSGEKLDAMVKLKRSLGCLQGQLLQLQASEVSRGVQWHHRELDRTWNFRRNWRPLPVAEAAAGDPPLSMGKRATHRGDRWLLKYLPPRQRPALPELMKMTAGGDGPATAAAGFTRARGRPLTARHHLRDPHDDVIRRFIHALQP